MIEDNIYANGASYHLREEDTTFVDAGPVVFGIEVRELNPEALQRRAPLEREYLTNRFTEAGFDLTDFAYAVIFFHVLGPDRTHYIRLDYQVGDASGFKHREAREWHWHYTPPSTDPDSDGPYDIPAIRTYYYDRIANGDNIWDWWFGCMEQRLADMLRTVGATELADRLDPEALSAAVSEARDLVRYCEERVTAHQTKRRSQLA